MVLIPPKYQCYILLSDEAQRTCYSGIKEGVWGVPDLSRCLTKAMYELQQKAS